MPPGELPPPGVVILGVGNLLMGDEGLGVRLLQWLEQHRAFPPVVELLDGGTAGLALLPRLEGAEGLLILDAVRSREPPGAIIVLEGNAVPARLSGALTPHQAGVSDLMAAMLLQGSLPPRVALVGIVPQNVSLGLELSPAVAAALPVAAERVALLLAEWKIPTVS